MRATTPRCLKERGPIYVISGSVALGYFDIDEVFGNRDEGGDKLVAIRFAQFRDVKVDLFNLPVRKPNPGDKKTVFDATYDGTPRDDDVSSSNAHTMRGHGGNDHLQVNHLGAALLYGGAGDDGLIGRKEAAISSREMPITMISMAAPGTIFSKAATMRTRLLVRMARTRCSARTATTFWKAVTAMTSFVAETTTTISTATASPGTQPRVRR